MPYRLWTVWSIDKILHGILVEVITPTGNQFVISILVIWSGWNITKSGPIGLNCTEDEKVLGTFVAKHNN